MKDQHPAGDDWTTRDTVVAILFALGGLALIGLLLMPAAIVNEVFIYLVNK